VQKKIKLNFNIMPIPRIKQVIKSLIMEILDEETPRKVAPLAENMYYEYRNDTSKLPHQKIGEAISEINKQMVQIERVLRMNARLKKEYGVSNERLWERTRRQMMKLEGRLTNLAGRLREMRG
jgi:hypothetical protein